MSSSSFPCTFSGASTFGEVVRQVTTGDYPPVATRNPKLSKRMIAIIERAMHLDPSRRFPDMRAMGRELLGLAGTWAAFLVRGVLSGRRQFRSYAITMVVEGASRLLPAIVLAVTGLTATWGFGLVFSFGFVIAALSGLVVARAPITDDVPPPDDVDRELESANQAAKRLARLLRDYPNLARG